MFSISGNRKSGGFSIVKEFSEKSIFNMEREVHKYITSDTVTLIFSESNMEIRIKL